MEDQFLVPRDEDTSINGPNANPLPPSEVTNPIVESAEMVMFPALPPKRGPLPPFEVTAPRVEEVMTMSPPLPPVPDDEVLPEALIPEPNPVKVIFEIVVVP